MIRGKLATQCSVRGSKPRRERTREYTGAPTRSSLPQFAFPSMVAITKVLAVRLKVQLYWTRSGACFLERNLVNNPGPAISYPPAARFRMADGWA